MTRASSTPRAAGVTLIELMVSVAIVGVIAAAAGVALRQSPTPLAARRVQRLLGEARRQAISFGPTRPDVREATGIRERARIEIGASGNFDQVELLRLREDVGAPTAQWVIEETFTLPQDAQIVGVAPALQTEPGGAAPPTLPATSAPVVLRFFPDGTSDPATVFLSDRRKAAGQEDPSRIALSPLTGTTSVLKGW